jgi:hypothetical protein
MEKKNDPGSLLTGTIPAGILNGLVFIFIVDGYGG